DAGAHERARRGAGERGLPLGAGSDAHLLRSVGRGRLLLRPYDGPDDFLEAAADGEIRGRESSRLVHLGSTWAKLIGRLGGPLPGPPGAGGQRGCSEGDPTPSRRARHGA
ncbi:MAG: PHP-associated domain-containing protein, partial [Gemmatimonadota bacterium]